MDSFFLTYYSVSSLIGLVMGLTMGIYFLSVRNSSGAMKFLAMLLICAGLMNVAYFISSSFIEPLAAYHRWMTVPVGLLMSVAPAQLFFHYPNNRWPRAARISLIAQLLTVVLPVAFFLISSIDVPLLYHFDGHYWDLVAEKPTKIVALAILANSVFQLVIGGMKIAVTGGRERWVILGLVIFLFGCGFAQGITNSLSRDGTVGRDVFQTTFSLTIVLGLFAVTVIYMNNTRDRTTFLAKIIGISMVTVLSVMQAISFSALAERTRAFDQLRMKEARAVHQGDFSQLLVRPLFLRKASGEIEYFAESGASDNSVSKPDSAEEVGIKEARLPILPFMDQFDQEEGNHHAPRQSDSDLQLGRFQKAKLGDDHLPYVSYVLTDPVTGEGYEVGFSYLAYRQYVHHAAAPLAILLLLVVLVLVAGFPLFFRGALIKPLMDLLGGMNKVDQGDLSANVKVRVEDEIGALGHYFNGMVVSIRDAQSKLKDYADRLEEKVQERTAELQKSLSRVQELKDQQDGDYFLTSLLLRPLQSNRAKSETVSIDFLVRQKKSFQFRKWNDEIGGDLCMAESIKLLGRPYTLFLNADAMGKSMQGAGGALVLGAVLEAIVDRTLLSGEASRHHPERWLKNAFIELHKVFETFDGSMLISLVFGLVDDDSGLVYMINAEHPWSVLYRNSQASFVESDLDFRKLGTLGVDSTIFVKTIQLEPGDVLIAGSDGRDDLLLQNPDGTETLQHDENVFLRHVESGKGNLEAVVDSLLSEGDLTDDLSLLRIGYREDLKVRPLDVSERFRILLEEARANYRSGRFADVVRSLEDAEVAESREAPLLRLLAQSYLRQKKFKQALAVAEDYAYLKPADTEMLYAVSYCAARCGELEKAADYGERIRLREPHNSRYLLNLARIYATKGNRSRAESFLEQVLDSEPDNEKALKLKEQLGSVAAN
ncbi:MAG: SpoIIE family protein phosphatase [Leptospiraceae bacterium]|nr:SpoIIE family protein phosphatase [Leptospiraceae bacterium]